MLLIDAVKVARKTNNDATLESVALEAFNAGKIVSIRGKAVTSFIALLAASDLVTAKIDEKPTVKTASMNKTAGLFDTVTSITECPHCQTKMKSIKLAEAQAAMYCPQCRHCDYDNKDKSRINAGTPSRDKHLEMKLSDPGHCEIKG
jgi:NADH pyrophosphatase NudC (nudix superfamily)